MISNYYFHGCLVFGNGGSGKTSLLESLYTTNKSKRGSYSYDDENEEYILNFPCDNACFSVWDTDADSAKDNALDWINDVNCAIICDDGTSRHSHGDRWSVRRWKKFIGNVYGANFPVLVVRTKADGACPGEVSQDGVVYVSALNGINVELPFRILAGIVPQLNN